jgi:hypothetical protein
MRGTSALLTVGTTHGAQLAGAPRSETLRTSAPVPAETETTTDDNARTPKNFIVDILFFLLSKICFKTVILYHLCAFKAKSRTSEYGESRIFAGATCSSDVSAA